MGLFDGIFGAKKKTVSIAGLDTVRIERWKVGQHIDKNDANKFDPNNTGHVYVGEVYRDGQLQRFFFSDKEKWEEFERKMEESRKL